MTEQVRQRIYDYIDEHFPEHLAAIQAYLRQPSISAQNVGMEACAEMTADLLRELGARVRLVTFDDGYPIVYGHLASGCSQRTLLVYGMYDVQPVEPLEAWTVPPFAAEIRDGRLIARGAHNTKGPLLAFLQGIRSIRAVAGDVPVNLLFVIEGEEEIGSPHLPLFIERHREELKAAEAVYYHMPKELIPGYPYVVLGYKGVAFLELEVEGQPTDVHSGMAPVVENPAWRLIGALQCLRDARGRILIEGFSDAVTPPDEDDHRLLAELDDVFGPEALSAMYGITRFRPDLKREDFARQLIFSPSLNIAGFVAGYTGSGMKTIIPARARCKIDIRLVPEMSVSDIVAKVRRQLDRQGYGDVRLRLLSGYGAAKTPVRAPVAQAALRALRELGATPRAIPLWPASAPQVVFNGPPLHLPVVISGLGRGGHMHAPNEYFEVSGLRDCEKSAVAFLYAFAESESHSHSGEHDAKNGDRS